VSYLLPLSHSGDGGSDPLADPADLVLRLLDLLHRLIPLGARRAGSSRDEPDRLGLLDGSLGSLIAPCACSLSDVAPYFRAPVWR
jgi:hypothetical protein